MSNARTSKFYASISLADYLLALSVEARLRNEEVMIAAGAFNYAGYVVGVIENKVLVLEGAQYVFDTGAFDQPWSDAQPVPSGTWHIMVDAIVSFGIMR